MYASSLIDEVTVGTTSAASEEIIYSDHVPSLEPGDGGRFQVPSGSSITSITWYDAPEVGGAYVAAYDEFGVAITQTVSDAKSYEIPTSLAGSAAIKAVGDAAGTIVVYAKG